MSKYLLRFFCWSAFALAVSASASAAPASLRLYAFDCGRAEFQDMGMFSDTGEYDGKPGAIADPCFLIVHPRGVLLWDTGLGDALAAQREGKDAGHGIRLHVDTPLAQQLHELKLTPEQISFVGFSHLHFDHTGNAGLFEKSRWLINKHELAAALSDSPPFAVDPGFLKGHDMSTIEQIEDDFDVFGDGAVQVLKAPGHTPGHQVLLIKLPRSGAVLLSGDLYHTRDNRRLHRVPRVNTDRADTLASFDRIERIVTNEHARVIVQHDPEDFASLPKFPQFLE
ncbi:MAG: N-acyl homoserine lactonase family protein [Povalibacter sp.]